MSTKPEVWYMGLKAYENRNGKRTAGDRSLNELNKTPSENEGVYLGPALYKPATSDLEKLSQYGLRSSVSVSTFDLNYLSNCELPEREADSLVLVDPFSEHDLKNLLITPTDHLHRLCDMVSQVRDSGKSPYLFPVKAADAVKAAKRMSDTYTFDYLDELVYRGIKGVVFSGREDYLDISRLDKLVAILGPEAKMGFYANGEPSVTLEHRSPYVFV